MLLFSTYVSFIPCCICKLKILCVAIRTIVLTLVSQWTSIAISWVSREVDIQEAVVGRSSMVFESDGTVGTQV
jgi:deoxycytidylate deaminase